MSATRRGLLGALLGALAVQAQEIQEPEFRQCQNPTDYPLNCAKKSALPGQCPQCAWVAPKNWAMVEVSLPTHDRPGQLLVRCGRCNNAYFMDKPTGPHSDSTNSHGPHSDSGRIFH